MFARGDVEGEGVVVDGAPGRCAARLTPTAIERSRDAIMVKLQRKGYPTRAIAKLLGMNQSNVVRRLNSIPPRVRERYEKIEILGL